MSNTDSNQVVHPGHSQEYRDRINQGYSPLIAALQVAVDATLAAYAIDGKVALVKTDLDSYAMWDEYLNLFADQALRQENNCSCCRSFFHRWANVGVLDSNGAIHPLLFSVTWTPEIQELMPVEYRQFFNKRINKQHIKALRPVYSDPRLRNLEIGTREANGFLHYHLTLKGVVGGKVLTRSPAQNAAESMEDYRLVREAMVRWTPEQLKQAAILLAHDARTKNSQFVNTLNDFIQLRTDVLTPAEGMSREEDKIRQRNVTMHACMTEAKGVLRLGQGVIGQFIADLASGVDAEKAMREFVTRTGGLLYQRAIAAPKEGTINRAEKIFEELGLADSLRRRSMRRDELSTVLWKPAVPEEVKKTGGVFDSIRAEKKADTIASPIIDGGKLSVRALLDLLKSGTVNKIEFHVPYNTFHGLASLTTAVLPESPPILRWDSPDKRNPVSPYTYNNPTPAGAWKLLAGTKVPVIAVVPVPAEFHISPDQPYDLNGILFILEHGYDATPNTPLAIFPQTIIPELHEVRSVIERFSNMGKLENTDEGLVGVRPAVLGHTFTLTHADGAVVKYVISSRD